MKQRFLIALLLFFSLSISFALFACGEQAVYSSLEMEDGIVYLTDFFVKYTDCEADLNNADYITNLSENISGEVQNYYLVMEFDIQSASCFDEEEFFAVEFIILDSDVVESEINYANTSITDVATVDDRTVITAMWSLPDEARKIKSVQMVIELKPKAVGVTDIIYSLSANDCSVTGYEEKDTTVSVSSNKVTISKTSLDYTLSDDGGSYLVTGSGTKECGILYIKDEYRGLPVTEIGDKAFYNYTTLKNIILPESIISIGKYAFYKCIALASVTIPDSVASIGADAFYGCTSLTNVFIPESVTSIGNYAFYGCTALNNITVSSANCTYKSIDGDLYSYDGQTLIQYAIGKTAKTFTIPDGVFAIESFAFYNCTALENITIPDSVAIIDSYAFYQCTSLTSVTIGSGVTSIGDRAFAYCTGLIEIYFNPTAAEDLSEDNYVFYKAGQDGEGITVTIGANVTKIPDYLFYPCSVNNEAPQIITLNFKEKCVCKSIGNYAFYKCSSLVSAIIPDSVTTVGNYAFYNCTSLNSVAIGSSVSNIGAYAFKNCTSLASINLPDSLTAIAYETFRGCTSLVSVDIPDGVSEIKNYAFYECTSLKSVIIGNGVTSVGAYAFCDCSALTNVTIGNSVISIGYEAFGHCWALKSAIFENTKGWYVINLFGTSNDPITVDVTNASQNASNLRLNYYLYEWHRSDEE